MAKIERHDIREYTIGVLADVSNSASTFMWLPIPTAGQVVRVQACARENNLTLDTLVSFKLGTVQLVFGGATAELLLEGLDAVGDVHSMEFDAFAKQNYATQAEEGDVVASGSVLQLVSDGGTAANAEYYFTFTIRP